MTARVKHRLDHRDYGLDSRDDRWSWISQAVCARNPELWFTGTSVRDAEARHICTRHCPVVRQCHADATAHKPISGVQGGLVWVRVRNRDHGEPGRQQPLFNSCGDHCSDYRP